MKFKTTIAGWKIKGHMPFKKGHVLDTDTLSPAVVDRVVTAWKNKESVRDKRTGEEIPVLEKVMDESDVINANVDKIVKKVKESLPDDSDLSEDDIRDMVKDLAGDEEEDEVVPIERDDEEEKKPKKKKKKKADKEKVEKKAKKKKKKKEEDK